MALARKVYPGARYYITYVNDLYNYLSQYTDAGVTVHFSRRERGGGAGDVCVSVYYQVNFVHILLSLIFYHLAYLHIDCGSVPALKDIFHTIYSVHYVL